MNYYFVFSCSSILPFYNIIINRIQCLFVFSIPFRWQTISIAVLQMQQAINIHLKPITICQTLKLSIKVNSKHFDNLLLIFSINVLIIAIAEICIWFNTIVHEWELAAVLIGAQSMRRSLRIVWEIISIFFLSQWGLEIYICHSSKWYFHYFKLAFRLILSEWRWSFGTSAGNVCC